MTRDGAHREIAIAGTSILPRMVARVFRRRANIGRGARQYTTPSNKLNVRSAMQKVGQTAQSPAGVAFRTRGRKRRGELISRVLRAGRRQRETEQR